MAVSKTQNERPAITALIDLANQLEGESNTHARNIETLTEGLADEVNDREAADTLLEETIQAEAEARAQAVQGVQSQIGEGIFSPTFTISQGFQQSGVVLQNMSDAIDDINQWQDRFKLGLTQNVTIAAGSSTSGTLAFESPFGEDAEVAVFPVCVDASGNFTDLSCKLISADYSGFSFAVYNDTQASVTTKVGFLAAKVN